MADGSRQDISLPKNDKSLILKFFHGNFSAIFPGDISSRVEELLVENGIHLDASLLLAAHHGSATSNSSLFLQTISPQHLIVSAGPYKSQHFPGPALSGRCEKLGITILHTATSGTVTVTSTGEEYTLVP
jgi:competence protein ComEC